MVAVAGGDGDGNLYRVPRRRRPWRRAAVWGGRAAAIVGGRNPSPSLQRWGAGGHGEGRLQSASSHQPCKEILEVFLPPLRRRWVWCVAGSFSSTTSGRRWWSCTSMATDAPSLDDEAWPPGGEPPADLLRPSQPLLRPRSCGVSLDARLSQEAHKAVLAHTRLRLHSI